MKTYASLQKQFQKAVRRLAHFLSRRSRAPKRRRGGGYERQYALLKSVLGVPVVCGVLGLVALPAQGTPLGFSADPMGSAWDRLDPNSGFATWDTFSSTSFSKDAPGSFSGIAGAALSQSSAFTNFGQGAGLYNVATSSPAASDGDVLFAGGNTLSFLLTGEVQFTIRGLTLQIKRPSSSGTLADASGFSPTLSINGGAALAADQFTTTTGTGDTNSSNGLWSVTTWYWGPSLASQSGSDPSTFALSFGKINSQRLLDGFAVDVGSQAAVPEPSSGLLMAFGAGAFLLSRRQRKASAAVISQTI